MKGGNRLLLTLVGIIVVLAGSFGAYKAVSYFLKAEEDTSMYLANTSPTVTIAGPTLSPTYTYPTSPKISASPSPTTAYYYIPDSPTASPESDLSENELTATPPQLPVTSTLPTWSGIAAGGLMLLITAALIL